MYRQFSIETMCERDEADVAPSPLGPPTHALLNIITAKSHYLRERTPQQSNRLGLSLTRHMLEHGAEW
jgi:hypothetical protein